MLHAPIYKVGDLELSGYRGSASSKSVSRVGVSAAAALLLTLVVCCACTPASVVPLAIQDAAPPKQNRVSYAITNYCATAGNTFGDMFLINSSYVISGGQIQLDSDRDGVPDPLDNNSSLGITPNNTFSTPNGFGDLPIFATGITVNSQALLMTYAGCPNPNLDSDGDGLSDCAESALLKTNPGSFDSDGDGIPDDLELRFGLNPLDPSDAQLNATGDGVSNIQKIKMQLPLREAITPGMQAYAHAYQVQALANNSNGQSCFNLTVTNIPVVNVANGNLIISYILEKSTSGSSTTSVKLNRCCSVVPSATADSTTISEAWGAADLICPCPLALDLKG